MAFESDNESLVRGRSHRQQSSLHDQESSNLHRVHFDLDVLVARQIAQHSAGAQLDSVVVIYENPLRAEEICFIFISCCFVREKFCDVSQDGRRNYERKALKFKDVLI